MAVPRPTAEDIAAFAAREHYDLGPEEVTAFTAAVTGGLASYDAVDALYEEHVAAPARMAASARESSAPGSNPYGAWHVKTRIEPTGSGALDGLRVAIKDNISVAGLPLMNGSRTLEGYTPPADATVVTRVLAAGGTIIGKTVCEDLCFSGSSFTSAPEPVRNPWDRGRSAGGSSSGNAVALAVGEADVAVGGDQGGSVRLPASYSGIVGHKPTYGLVPYTGAFPIERTVDHLGPMAADVAQTARLLSVLAGPDGLDPRQAGAAAALPPENLLEIVEAGAGGLTIGLLTEGFAVPGSSDPRVDALVRDAARGLAGATVVDVSVPWHSRGLDIWNVITTDGGAYQMLAGNGYGMNVPGFYEPEIMSYFAEGKATRGADLAATVKLVGLAGSWGLEKLGGATYGKAHRLAPLLRNAYDAALERCDVLVMPTTPTTALELLHPGDDLPALLGKALGMVGNTAPFDVSGHPATSVPAGLVDGLPAGLMVVAPHGRDDLALRVARAVEQARGPLGPPRDRVGGGA